MDAIVKQSGLNPFATCFIPSNFKKNGEDKLKKLTATKKYEDKTKKSKVPNVKYVTDIVKFKAAKHLKKKKKLDIVLSYPLVNGIFNCKKPFCKRANENVYFAKDIPKIEIFKPNQISWTKEDVAILLKLLLMILFRFYPRQYSLTYNVGDHDGKSDDLEDNSTSNEECCCPPMFGCIIPPQFFGNPLKLSTSCNKKFVHVCHHPNAERNRNIEPRERRDLKSQDLLENVKGWTRLDQYTFQLEQIVEDVCNIIDLATYDDIDRKKQPDSDSYINSIWCPLEKADLDNEIKVVCEENHEESDFFATPKIPSSRPDHSNLDNLVIEMEIPVDTPTIDYDDLHPLLDEGISMMDNDGEEVSPIIEKMIETSFSPRRGGRLSFDPEEMAENICNPPCSVWCDRLPQPAKDTYRKFITGLPEQDKELTGFVLNGKIAEHKSLKNIYGKFMKNLPEKAKMAFNGENFREPKFPFTRPLYKRSFSANDCPEPNQYLTPIQSSFDAESMTKQILGDPSNYSKSCYLNQTLKDIKRTQSLPLNENSSLYLINESISTKSRKDGCASKWGPFDGEDSLWQPLPDCVASNENIKQSSHKRVRELKRQRSLN